MPKDPRLFMTFPIDFDEHPKVVPLSDAAFRVFVAMNGYSRRNDLDGRIPAAVARSKWKARALAELVASHPERPLVHLDGDVYVLRSYGDHQDTKASREERRMRNTANGAKGGRPPKPKPTLTHSVTDSVSQTEPGRVPTGKQSSEFRENYQDLPVRPNSRSDPAEDDASLSPTVAAVVRATAECGLRVHPLCASSVVDFIESRRGRNPRPVKVPTKYYPDAIRQSWPEIEKFIHENGLAS